MIYNYTYLSEDICLEKPNVHVPAASVFRFFPCNEFQSFKFFIIIAVLRQSV